MRILKLLAVGLLGYAAFQFIRGYAAGGTSPAKRADRSRRAIGEGSSREFPTGQILTSTGFPGAGMEVTTGDVGGSSFRHRVGRGVVAREN